LLEHFVSNFQISEIESHLEKLLEVFFKKLETYFLQIGTLSQKKNMALYNFEDLNIRCFYQRLKDYYSSKGWDSVEGLAKVAGTGGSRKAKLVRLAANIVEKAGSVRQPTKGTLSYYPVGNELKKQNARKNENVSSGLMKIIAEELIEDETAAMLKQVEDSPTEMKALKSKYNNGAIGPTGKKKEKLNESSTIVAKPKVLNEEKSFAKRELDTKKDDKANKTIEHKSKCSHSKKKSRKGRSQSDIRQRKKGFFGRETERCS
jgi:hypothetical protein